jgi:hypothetical protein
MPADFLSQNAIDVIGIFSEQWKLAQEYDKFCSSIKHIPCTNILKIVLVNT